MSIQSEIRSWVVAGAAVFCLGVIGYRALTLPTIPDLTATIAQTNAVLSHLQTASDTLTTGLQGAQGLLMHVQATTDAATGALRAATPVVANLNTTESKLNDGIDLTFHRINDLCPAPGELSARPCGTLADANRTLATFRGTSGQVEESLRVFNLHEGTLFDQEGQSYALMNKSFTDFDDLVSEGDLRRIFGNAATITDNAAAVTTDGRTWIHRKLYPTKKQGFVSGFEATGDAVHHWLPPIF